MRALLATTAAAVAAMGLAGCGTESIQVPESDSSYKGAELFSQRCAGCHTLTPAGTQGTADRAMRTQGPNLDQREETVKDVLFAIRNGGFSGAIMPQNIVTGQDAKEVADFVAEYAGTEAVTTANPSESSSQGSGSAP